MATFIPSNDQQAEPAGETNISLRLAALQARMRHAREQTPLAAPDVTLLAASKGQALPVLREALAAGLRDFGENRVQEAESKWPALRETVPGLRLHLIGPLQTNKAAQAVKLFDLIHTLDSVRLADALASAMARLDRRVPCLVQVNTGQEPQKTGVMPQEADALIRYCRTSLQLPLAGLMCIPPQGQPPAPHFALLRKIALEHGLETLSMGMSEDFETAIRMGSTCVRLGRALFGNRQLEL